MNEGYVKVNSDELQELVDRIEDAVDGEQPVHISIACLIVAIYAQKPDVAPDKLKEIVKGMSEWMAVCFNAPNLEMN